MKQWQRLFSSRILTRGRDYYSQARVRNTKLDSHGDFSTDVIGTHIYHVTGNYREEQATKLTCTCPYAADGNYCKHMAAALYRVEPEAKRNERRNTPMQKLAEFLGKDYDQPELIINPIDLVGKQKFPQKFVKTLRQTLDQLQMRDQQLEDYHNPYLQLEKGQWQYSLHASIGNAYLSTEVKFVRDHLLGFNIGYTMTNSTQERAIAKLVTYVSLAKYLLNHNIGEASSNSAYQLLNYYRQSGNNAQSTVIKAFIDDHGIFSDEPPVLYFRVGVPDHMYKFQNITSLVNQIERGEVVNLGKYFNQVINPAMLDKSSRIWLDFMRRLATIGELNETSYSLGPGIKNQLFIEGEIADELDQAFQDGGELYSGRLMMEREESQLEPKLILETNGKSTDPQRSIRAYVPVAQNLIRGNNAYYKVSFNRWQVFTMPSMDLSPFLQKDNEVEFGTSTMAEFYYRVLPQLAKQIQVKVKGNKDLKEFVPELSEPLYLFDYHEGQLYCRFGVKTGEHEEFLSQMKPSKLDDHFIQRMLDPVEKYFTEYAPEIRSFVIPVEDADDLLTWGIDELKKVGIVKGTPAFKRLLNKPITHFSVNIDTSYNLLDLKIDADGLSIDEINQLLKQYQPKQNYYQVGTKKMVNIKPAELEELRELVTKLGLPMTELTSNRVKLPLYRAMYLDSLLEQRQLIDYRTNDDFKKLVKQVEKKSSPVKVPGMLQATLRPYQKAGFRWLAMLAKYGFGGLLADEMGLGKTIQIISLILNNYHDGQSIVITPAAVIYNWQNEFAKFAPSLTLQVLDGSKAERRSLFTSSRDKDVIITSYGAFKRDVDFYQDYHFNNEIIDEAQYIKNPQTAASKAVKSVAADHRFALTGTPIENQLSELWSIFDFLMPGFLNNYSQFRKNYETPIIKHHDRKAEDELKQLIQPFILRRLKKDVLKELPDKTEHLVYTPMIGQQAKLYQARATRLVKRLQSQDDEEFKNNRFEMLAEITRLRQLCCSPKLLNADYRGRSGKVDQTMELIRDEIAAGHKILLFSQFTSALVILRQQIEKEQISDFVIEGKTKKSDRQAFVKEFNTYDGPAIFLISLKAGGTGLNLTSADVVIHFDPWWNVAAENQATDRAHRIGQQHNVSIYKMIAKDTIEERIIAMQKQKSELANAILSGDEIGSTALDRETLLKLLG